MLVFMQSALRNETYSKAPRGSSNNVGWHFGQYADIVGYQIILLILVWEDRKNSKITNEDGGWIYAIWSISMEIHGQTD